jgi:hypothetical protein
VARARILLAVVGRQIVAVAVVAGTVIPVAAGVREALASSSSAPLKRLHRPQGRPRSQHLVAAPSTRLLVQVQLLSDHARFSFINFGFWYLAASASQASRAR